MNSLLADRQPAMKECFKCHKTLPLSEFYADPRMRDGHLNKCKECTRRDVSENRKAKVGYYRDYDRVRFHENTDRRQYQYRTAKELRKKYPTRDRARTATGRAKRGGMLIRQPCETCGTTLHVEAHHDDYSKPLRVRWLCRTHHNQHHHPF